MEPQCQCENKTLVKRVLSNGALHFGTQCPTCGDWKAVSKAGLSPVQLAMAEKFDEGIKDRYWAERREKEQAELQQQRQEQSEEWWAAYREYMESEAWRDKRRRVLERDNHLCQACLKRPATQVHHLTYDHFGDEPLFELESICRLCHDHLTQLDRERRNGNHRS